MCLPVSEFDRSQHDPAVNRSRLQPSSARASVSLNAPGSPVLALDFPPSCDGWNTLFENPACLGSHRTPARCLPEMPTLHSSEGGTAICQILSERSDNNNQESAIRHKQRSEGGHSLLDGRGKQ